MEFRLVCTFIFALLLNASSHAFGDAQSVDREKAFRFRLASDPSTLDWTQASTSWETYVMMNIMEGLVEFDRRLQPAPALADSWEISKDGRIYTFHIRPHVKWSDGVELAAKDFVTSWRRLLDSRTKNDYASFLFDIENAEAFHRGKISDFSKVGVKALGKDKLEIRLRRVVPYFVSLLSFWVTFPQREDRVAAKNWADPTKIVVVGPYKITRWARKKEIVFERNPLYYGPPPPLSKIEAVVEPDDIKARKLLLDGKIDALLHITTEDILALGPSDNTRILRQFDYLSTVFLAFNVRANPFNKPEFRKAIAQALDRSGVPSALRGGEQQADSLVPKGMTGYEQSTWPISVTEARMSLLNAGYRSPAEVPPITILSTRDMMRGAAEYVQKTLRSILDVNFEIKALEPQEYVKTRRSGHYQAVLTKWGADYPDASSFMELFLSDNPYNYTGWRNARYDSLVKEAGRSLKILDRLRAYSDAQRILLHDDAVIVPLYYPKITALVSNRVAEFDITPLNYFFFKRLVMK